MKTFIYEHASIDTDGNEKMVCETAHTDVSPRAYIEQWNRKGIKTNEHYLLCYEWVVRDNSKFERINKSSLFKKLDKYKPTVYKD